MGAVPKYTKSEAPTVLWVADYKAVDKRQDLYSSVDANRVTLRLSAKYLVSKWNLEGGPQESIMIEANSKTFAAWQDCLGGTLARPVVICQNERPRLIRVWSNIRPVLPIRTDARALPDMKDHQFPDRKYFLSRTVERAGNFDRYEILSYDDVWSRWRPNRTQRVGDVDVYSTSLFMYPRDYSQAGVKLVECTKPDTFCKAYAVFRGKWVEFLIFKDELANIDDLGAGILRFLDQHTR
jgi:hypothetical protein